MLKRILSFIIVITILSSFPFAVNTSAAETNEQIIYNFLRNDLGLNRAQACGVLGNIYSESRFNPEASCIDTDGLPSYGICQWHATRLDTLKSYCKNNGLDYKSLTGQLAFFKYEIQNSEKVAFSKLNGIENTRDGAYTAGYNWAKYFERCAEKYYESRGVLAQTFFDKYKVVDNPPEYTAITEGNYYIRNNKTETYLTVPSKGQSNGTDVALGELSTDNYFKIKIKKTGDSYTMKPLYTTSAVINVYATLVESGKNVTLYQPTGSLSQAWKFEKKSDNSFVIRSADSPNCVLTLSDSSVIVKSYTSSSTSQRWTLVPCEAPPAVTPTVTPGTDTTPTVITWGTAKYANKYELRVKTLEGETIVSKSTTKTEYSGQLPAGNYKTYVYSVNSLLSGISSPYKTKGTTVEFTVGTSHVHDFTGAEETVREATCSEPGLKWIHCTDPACDAYSEVEIPVIPHTNSTVVIPPTATEPGYIENVCSVCGNIEVIETIPAEGDGSPSITVSDGAAFSGQTVPLSVTLNNSYGIGSASFYFIYDSDRAELLEVKTSDGNIVNLAKLDDSVYFELKGCKVNEASITCVFKTREGSVGDVSVSVSYGLASILKSDESVVYPAVDPGVITIADPALKGDANRDNSVDAKDVLLMRKYIAGLEDAESLDMFFADTNSDGSVDMKDVLYARRSIAGLIIS